MRKAILILTMTGISYAVQSQRLVLMPQIGTQSFQMDVNSNSLFYGYKTHTLPSPTLGARLMYFSKNGHGPYAGFRIGDLNVSSYDSSAFRTTGITLRQYQLGYQWLSKPLYFKRIWNNHLSPQDFESMTRKGLAVQFMPSAGLVYTSGRGESISYMANNVNYKENSYRGNMGVDLGLGMVFSNNGRQLFSLNFGYTKSFGNIYSGTTQSGSYLSNLKTQASGWNVSLGVPLTLLRKK